MLDTNLDRDYCDTRVQGTEGQRVYHRRMQEHLAPALQTWAESQWAIGQQRRPNPYARQIEADVLRNFNRLVG